MEEKILFVLTGGTIDSKFEPTKDAVVPNEESTVSKYIAKLKLYNHCIFSKVCMKDSRDLTLGDRKNMLAAIEDSGCKKVIITHGTYTIAETAQYLQQKLKNNNLSVVLNGAMIPLEGFYPSDAPFNIGYAVSSIQHLPNGVYICMNGKVFKPEKVDKNEVEGRFEEKRE